MYKTNVIDPIYHSNLRTELRLDSNRVYAGDVRLANLGCTVVTNPPDQYLMYNTSAGALALIENIYLYDGNTLLDQILNAHHVFSFRTLQNTNGVNKNGFNSNINQYLIGTTNSYDIKKDPNGTANQLPKLRANELPYYAYATSVAQAVDTLQGYVNLTYHLNFLKGLVYNVNGQPSLYVDTNVFKNLRIVIEWRPQAQMVSVFQGTTTGVQVTVLPPQLICDEMIGMTLPQQLVMQYDSYEVDKLVCNGSVAGGDVITKARLNAFNNKYVKKLLFMNIDTTKLTNDDAAGVDGIKCDGSQVYNNEVLQLFVNGAQLWDFNGVDSDARRLSILADAWGPLNIPLGAYLNIPQDLSPLLSKQCLDLEGRMSYTGALIGQRITELAVEHKRTVPANGAAFMMYVWGEVVKQLNIQNGQYNISYV